MKMSTLRYRFTRWFLKSAIGNIQVHKYPCFIMMGDTHYKIKGKDQRKIIDLLQPGDVLLRRWDHYLSGMAIPGYFCHAGIYVGDNSMVHSTCHAGVILEDILEFTRADSIAILRVPRSIAEKVRNNVIPAAKALIGTDYDFLYDFKNNQRMSCTELIKEAYKNIPEILIDVENDGVARGMIIPDALLECGFDTIFCSCELPIR